MTSPQRFLVRFERVVPLIVVAIWLFEAGCGSPDTKAPDAGVDAAPDAAGVDTAPDVAAADTATDVGAPSDVASADVAQVDGGGGDSAADPCQPPCWVKLVNGCVPEGACIHSLANYCYANGVNLIASPPGNAIIQTITKNGVLCVTVDRGNNYIDPSGNVLGYVTNNLDQSTTVTCTGDAPQTIPASCSVSCTTGTCP